MKPTSREILAGSLIALIAIILFHSVVASSPNRQKYWDELRWDEGFYCNIAVAGYKKPATFVEHSNLPFSPGWPALWSAVATVTGNGKQPQKVRSVLAALLFIIGSIGMLVALRSYSNDAARNRLTLLLFCVWPGSLYFLTGYAETLYFALLPWFFACLAQRRYVAGSILAAVCIFTRSPAIVLVPTLAASMLIDANIRANGDWRRALRENWWQVIVLCLIPLLGTLAYMVVLQVQVGDAFAFLKSYDAWNQVRETRLRSMALQTPVIAWFGLPNLDGVRMAIGMFLLIPLFLILFRPQLPADMLVFVAVSWIYFLSEQSELQPFLDMLRWTALLFPFHYCAVLIIERFARLWGRDGRLWRAVLCIGIAVVYGAFYVRLLIRFIAGQWVS